MTDTKFAQYLTRMDACTEAVAWVGDRDIDAAWAECQRGDWMLWLAGRVGVDRKALVLAACDITEQVLIHVPKGEDRPRNAIETARAWCRGEATTAEVRAAAHAAADAIAAVAADVAAYAAHAAAYASVTAAVTAAADTAAVTAAYVADAYAAHAEAVYAADAADDADARTESLAKSADLVRARIPLADIRAALESQ